MNLLERYIFRRTLSLSLMTLSATTVMVLITQVLIYVNLLTASGQAIITFFALAATLVPPMLNLVMPFALHIGATQTLNGMNSDSGTGGDRGGGRIAIDPDQADHPAGHHHVAGGAGAQPFRRAVGLQAQARHHRQGRRRPGSIRGAVGNVPADRGKSVHADRRPAAVGRFRRHLHCRFAQARHRSRLLRKARHHQEGRRRRDPGARRRRGAAQESRDGRTLDHQIRIVFPRFQPVRSDQRRHQLLAQGTQHELSAQRAALGRVLLAQRAERRSRRDLPALLGVALSAGLRHHRHLFRGRRPLESARAAVEPDRRRGGCHCGARRRLLPGQCFRHQLALRVSQLCDSDRFDPAVLDIDPDEQIAALLAGLGRRRRLAGGRGGALVDAASLRRQRCRSRVHRVARNDRLHPLFLSVSPLCRDVRAVLPRHLRHFLSRRFHRILAFQVDIAGLHDRRRAACFGAAHPA